MIERHVPLTIDPATGRIGRHFTVDEAGNWSAEPAVSFRQGEGAIEERGADAVRAALRHRARLDNCSDPERFLELMRAL